MKTAPKFVFMALIAMMAVMFFRSSLVAARCGTATLQTQAIQGGVIVRGVITDVNDARIVDASLRFARDGVTLKTRTNRDGSYEIRLGPGSYDIEIDANGFRRIHKKQFEVRSGPAIELDLKMVVAVFIDPITVESDLPNQRHLESRRNYPIHRRPRTKNLLIRRSTLP